MLFPVLYLISLGYTYFRTRTWRRPLRPMEMDYVSNIKEVEDDSYDEPPPKNWMERFWMWLVSIHVSLTLGLVSFSMLIWNACVDVRKGAGEVV